MHDNHHHQYYYQQWRTASEISIAYLLLLCGLACVGKIIFKFGFFTTLFTMIGAAFIFASTHRLGHTQLIREWYRSHVGGHHFYAYPPNRTRYSQYIDNKHDVYNLNTYAYLLSGIVYLGFIYCFIQRNLYFITWIAFIILILLYVEYFIHLHVHFKQSWLETWQWFRFLRDVHDEHHRSFKFNYAVVAIFTDIFAGTFLLPRDLCSSKKTF